MASYEYPAPTKKRKQATFTEDELEVMVTEVAKRKHVIFPAFSETITRRLKDSLGRGDSSCQSGTTLHGKQEVPSEAEVVLPCINIPPSPVCISTTEDHHYAARNNRQEFSSRIPTPNSSNSASHPSSRPVTPSSSRLANHQLLVEIQREIHVYVRDAADSLRSIASSLSTLVTHILEK
ncbi:hypothetical protein Pcinc_012236 [Petrolisthes cinctipes]|uniref:Regulatory protein zeste n=1 Tax=Petrolisthes cinctipes TaxID=88211 RepID=A0AAE1KJZ1_PETCI|nr:hypothetical protein Pcinc_019732 [Petrolisthes cinctipes]KAK3883460.1 hypothetical protein Pcinc_012236 [Petrolisthes cinctipes]